MTIEAGKMKKIIFIIWLFITNTCAAGYLPSEELKIREDWVQVTANMGYYLNLHTVRKNGNNRNLWIMDEKGEDGPSKFQVELNCKEEAMKLIHMINYSDSGDILYNSNVSDTEDFKPIIPGSIGEYILRFTCSLEV